MNDVEIVWDRMKRNTILTIILFVSLCLIGFERETLRTLITCVVIGSGAVIFSGIVLYCYTKFNFIKKEDTNAIVQIFKAVCFLFGFVVAGCYFAQFH